MAWEGKSLTKLQESSVKGLEEFVTWRKVKVEPAAVGSKRMI